MRPKLLKTAEQNRTFKITITTNITLCRFRNKNRPSFLKKGIGIAIVLYNPLECDREEKSWYKRGSFVHN